MTIIQYADYFVYDLHFLKLGGSLITDKSQPHTARLDVIDRLAHEINDALLDDSEMHLVIGHGSGSFGHIPASKFGTRQGVHTPDEWRGFLEVWREAASLNRLVMDALRAAGVPAISFPPSASVTARDGALTSWNLAPIQIALQHAYVPVIYGDVIFDEVRGGTIFSTEDLFTHLARVLRPERILLAGQEAGVWEDFPTCTRLIEQITPQNFPQVQSALGGSAHIDVTGGMQSKVRQMLSLATEIPELQVRIFSGKEPDFVRKALERGEVGTLISGQN